MSRSIEVDSQMLAEGMKITFFGISTVFASMGISDEAAKFLGIREAGKETSEGMNFRRMISIPQKRDRYRMQQRRRMPDRTCQVRKVLKHRMPDNRM